MTRVASPTVVQVSPRTRGTETPGRAAVGVVEQPIPTVRSVLRREFLRRSVLGRVGSEEGPYASSPRHLVPPDVPSRGPPPPRRRDDVGVRSRSPERILQRRRHDGRRGQSRRRKRHPPRERGGGGREPKRPPCPPPNASCPGEPTAKSNSGRLTSVPQTRARTGRTAPGGEGAHPVHGEDVPRTLGVRPLGRGPGRAVRSHRDGRPLPTRGPRRPSGQA